MYSTYSVYTPYCTEYIEAGTVLGAKVKQTHQAIEWNVHTDDREWNTPACRRICTPASYFYCGTCAMQLEVLGATVLGITTSRYMHTVHARHLKTFNQSTSPLPWLEVKSLFCCLFGSQAELLRPNHRYRTTSTRVESKLPWYQSVLLIGRPPHAIGSVHFFM